MDTTRLVQRRWFLAMLAAAASAMACTSMGTGPSLEGRWQPVSAQLGGRELPVASFNGAVLLIQAGTYQFGNDSGALAMGPAGPPAQMDILGKAGPNAGRTLPAIFSIGQEELVVCYQLGSGPRPAVFASPPGTQILLIRYRRA